MADEEKFMRWKISTNTVYNTLKTDTKCSHSVRGRPILKDEECFRKGLVRKPHKRSLREQTFMSIVNKAEWLRSPVSIKGANKDAKI